MERRKFIAAMGSVAAGGAATVGTGAFTSVEADRSVDVEVAGDANAFLGLDRTSDPNSQTYVTGTPSSGEVAFDFSDDNGATDLGDGFNPNAVTEVDNLLEVTNQGTQTVHFYVDVRDIDLSDGDGGQATLQLEAKDSVGASSNEEDNIAEGGGASPTPVDVQLGTGDSVVLDLIVDTTGFSPTSSYPLGTSGTATFVADTTDGI